MGQNSKGPRSPRKSKRSPGRPKRVGPLDDPDNQARILEIIGEGGTKTDAALAVGSYRKALHRYIGEHADFRQDVERAQAAADRDMVINPVMESSPPIHAEPAPLPPVNRGPPRSYTREAAEIMDVDLDLMEDVDASLPVIYDTTLPPMTAANVLAFQWSVMHDKASPPILRKACNDVVATYALGPAMAAQKRRNERADRLALAASVVDVETSPDMSDGDGLVVLEIPANGSEAPGHAPRPQDEADL